MVRPRLFTVKLDIVVHNLAHQLLNHLLPDDRILLTVFAIASMTSSASSAARSLGSVASTVGRVQRFKDSIAQARFHRANRHTLKAAPATGETKKASQRISAIGR